MLLLLFLLTPCLAHIFQYGAITGSDNLFSDSKGLQDFAPISNTIKQSETQYYSFNVNTSTGVGEYYEFLIFLTGNICSQPSNLDSSDPPLTVYYSFNASMMTNLEVSQMVQFKNGYFQALADVPVETVVNNNSVVYIAVRAPENTNTSAVWSYQLGVSQNDLVFQWDDRSWASVVDTDASSVLIVTGNLTTGGTAPNVTENATESQYSLYLYSYDYKDYFTNLNASWCAIRNGPALKNPTLTSYTLRNGILQQQFYITGLNQSTKYLGYVVTDFSGSTSGGAVYKQFEFETMGESVCELVYDLPFCDHVAYSVPTSRNLTKSQLSKLYDDYAKSLYSNFSKALQQIACDTTPDALFSTVTTCDACADSYKNWLCAVSIPRCTTWNITGTKERQVGESRNSFINEVIIPNATYSEILPCLNVCQAMVRNCPADFGFACPTRNDTVSLSYYWDTDGEYVSCNYVGKKVVGSGSHRVKVGWLIILVFFVML